MSFMCAGQFIYTTQFFLYINSNYVFTIFYTLRHFFAAVVYSN